MVSVTIMPACGVSSPLFSPLMLPSALRRSFFHVFSCLHGSIVSPGEYSKWAFREQDPAVPEKRNVKIHSDFHEKRKPGWAMMGKVEVRMQPHLWFWPDYWSLYLLSRCSSWYLGIVVFQSWRSASCRLFCHLHSAMPSNLPSLLIPVTLLYLTHVAITLCGHLITNHRDLN